MPSSKPPIEPADPDLLEELPPEDPPVDLVDGDLEGCLLDGADLSSRDAGGLRLTDCMLVDVDLSGTVLTRGRIRDTEWRDGSLANVRADQADIRRTRFERVRMTGAILAGAHIEDATFIECRLDLSNFRAATLERVRFEGCLMHEADIADARCTSVVFRDCDLTGLQLFGVTFERSEMRGSDLEGASGLEHLRGIRMPWPDVVGSMSEIAQAAGIEVVD